MVVIKNKDSPELQKMGQYQFHDHTHSHNLATNKNRDEKYTMHSLTIKKVNIQSQRQTKTEVKSMLCIH